MITTYSFPECTGYGVCRMDPTICVQHIFWNVFSMNTIDRISNILPCCHYQREGQQKCDCGSIVETKDARIDGHMMRFHETLESPKYFQHFQISTLNSLKRGKVLGCFFSVFCLITELFAPKYSVFFVVHFFKLLLTLATCQGSWDCREISVDMQDTRVSYYLKEKYQGGE